jgi:hypothetical protein
MRHARRLIITLVGVTFWCVAATTDPSNPRTRHETNR